MRILLLTPHYRPEIRSVSVLMSQLAEDLSRAGHTVTVISPYPPANMAGATSSRVPARENHGGVRVIRAPALPFVKVAPTVRAVTQFTLAGSMVCHGLWAGHHDLIIVYSPPLTLALAAEILGRRWHAPFIVNVQDLYPQALIDLGLARNPVVIKVLEWLENRAYQRSSALTVHSPGNLNRLVARGVPAAKVTIVPNWIDTVETVPLPKENTYREQLGLRGQFVVLFAGVMGYAQDMTVIVEAAAAVGDDPAIVFLLVGDGVRRREAEDLVRSRGIRNVRFLPFQPLELYPLLVSAADCCLTTLQASVATPVVPSKIAGILAAARPVVAALPAGDARELVETSGGGICVPPGDWRALANSIRGLADNPEACQAMGDAGRRYVEVHLARVLATGTYIRIVEAMREPASAAGDSNKLSKRTSV